MNTQHCTDYPSRYRPTLVVVSCCASGHADMLGHFDGITRETVRFADLNLASLADVAELYRRIEYTARKVCRDHVRDREECTRRAVNNAITKIDRPALTAFHRSKLLSQVSG